VRGIPAGVIENIRISDSIFSGVTETEVVEHAGTITFKRVTVQPAKTVKGLNSIPPPK